MEHLQHHLVGQHAGANSQLLKCRWKNCEEFFCPRNRSKQVFKNQKSTFLEEGVLVRGLNSEGVSSMQEMLVHMQKHAEEETQLEP